MMDYVTAKSIRKALEDKGGLIVSEIEARAMTEVISDDDTENYVMKKDGNFFIAKVERHRNGDIKEILVGEIGECELSSESWRFPATHVDLE